MCEIATTPIFWINGALILVSCFTLGYLKGAESQRPELDRLKDHNRTMRDYLKGIAEPSGGEEL